MLRLSNGGKTLDSKMAKEILEQELRNIQINNPKRFNQIADTNISTTFVTNFAKRNGLMKFISQEAMLGSKRRFECDVCGNKFTLKNSLVAHKKTIHRIKISPNQSLLESNQDYFTEKQLLREALFDVNI